MTQLIHRAVANGTHWVSIPHLRKNLLIGCPPNAVKHLVAQGLLRHPDHGRTPPSPSDATPLDPLHAMAAHGLHAVVLADRHWHADGPANMAEFPMLHALYALPQEARPILVGHPEQLRAQTEYIMRGHYGLQSEAELRELGGLSTAQARLVMRLKLFFSGGTQYRADELFDLRPLVGVTPIELLPDVWLQRVAPSVLRIDHGGEHLEIDLDQRVGPLRPTVELVPRACPPTGFAVTHIGQGDGWSPDAPSMSSLITWQGKHYLVDAGPEALLCLRALGLCVHDIEGVFQTHCHDDHIAGLLDLMRSSRRIRFFAPAMVSASVMRKLCALAVMPQRDVAQYFAVEDLALERWNDIDGLRVRPFLSPHPVETTAYTFLARTAGGTRSYSPLADLCSLQHLREMAEGSQPVLTPASLRRVLQNYWRPASVKKIDIGGGLVHGDARDFRGDHSRKIVLAHTSRVLDADELAIGQRLAFGERDELLRWTAQERTQHIVHRLQTLWPNAPQVAFKPWLADGVLHLPSHTLIHEHLDHVLVLISGRVLSHDPDQGRFRTLSAGHRLGEADALGLATQSVNTYFAGATQCVLDQGGNIDKFIGDAIMAEFGAPIRRADHALCAITAAVKMIDNLASFRVWFRQHLPELAEFEFDIGIGIHTGAVTMGNVGTAQRTEYTALGDTVNAAARLEGATKETGFHIVASDVTVSAAGPRVITGRRAQLHVKGRKEPLVVHEVLGLRPESDA